VWYAWHAGRLEAADTLFLDIERTERSPICSCLRTMTALAAQTPQPLYVDPDRLPGPTFCFSLPPPPQTNQMAGFLSTISRPPDPFTGPQA